MSRIPKKKSRRITVDGVVYRWLVKDASSRFDHMSDQFARVIVQIEDKHPGTPLVAVLASKRWTRDNEDDVEHHHKAAIMPKDIRELILYGLKLAWNPHGDPGSVHTLTGDLDLGEYSLVISYGIRPVRLKPIWARHFLSDFM